MKKVIKIITYIATVSIMLCACTSSQGIKEEKEEREKLILWSYYETDAQTRALDQLINGFNQSQEQYEFSWEYVPMTDFTRRLSIAYTEESLPDLALIDSPDMSTCIKMGMFEDITPYLSVENIDMGDYYPVVMETATNAGKIYGMPACCNNLALIYNKEMLEEEDIVPPVTWSEFRYAAERLTTEDRSGFMMSGIDGEQGAFQMLAWLLASGEEPDTIGSEATLEVVKFLDDLTEKGWMSENCINLSQTDVARCFVNGETAMMENGPWVFPMLREAGMDFGAVPLPTDTGQRQMTVAGGENFGVLKGKNTEGAVAFLKYYNQKKVMQRFCELSCSIPPRESVSLSAGEAPEQMNVFKMQMNHALIRTEIRGWHRYSENLSKIMFWLVSDECTPEQAVERLNENIS